MADTTQATADGATQDEQKDQAATTAGTGEPDKKDAETGAAKPDTNDDERPVTHRDLRRVLKSKDHWKERALRLEGELKARQDGQVRQAPKSDEPKAPKPEDYDTHEAYLEAKVEWLADQKVDKKLQEREERQSKAKAAEADKALTDSWTASVAKVREKYDDYDEVTQDEGFNPTPAMARAMLESDHKAEIAYYLAKNPEEMERIAKLSPLRQAAEVMKLEDKVSASAKSPAKKPSKAPPPIDPVGGKSKSDENSLRDDLPMAEWLARRQKQVHGR